MLLLLLLLLRGFRRSEEFKAINVVACFRRGLLVAAPLGCQGLRVRQACCSVKDASEGDASCSCHARAACAVAAIITGQQLHQELLKQPC